HALHLYHYRATMRVDGREISLAPGDVTLSPMGRGSSYHLPEPGHHACIHFFPVAAARSGTKQVMAVVPIHMTLGGRSDVVAQCIDRIARLHVRGTVDPVAGAAASAALQDLLLRLALWNADNLPRGQGRHSD